MRFSTPPRLLALLSASLLAACSSLAPGPALGPALGLPYQAPHQPEGQSGYTEKPGWQSSRFAVAAANPLATDAGYQVIKAGGSALDAAVAVQMVLTLVEPQSSGLGGGAFLLHFDGRSVQAYDGRETAPAAADEQLFLKPDGQPMAFSEGVVGGRSVGVPGSLRMLELAHRQHGQLPWASLFQPAITLAEQGFRVSPRLHQLLAADPHLRKDPVAAAYFYDEQGQPWPVGHRLKNSEQARVARVRAHLVDHGLGHRPRSTGSAVFRRQVQAPSRSARSWASCRRRRAPNCRWAATVCHPPTGCMATPKRPGWHSRIGRNMSPTRISQHLPPAPG